MIKSWFYSILGVGFVLSIAAVYAADDEAEEYLPTPIAETASPTLSDVLKQGQAAAVRPEIESVEVTAQSLEDF